MQQAMSFSDAAVVYVKEKHHRTHFWRMSKDEPINIMQNSNLKEKRDCKIIKILILLWIYKRWILTMLIIKDRNKDC